MEHYKLVPLMFEVSYISSVSFLKSKFIRHFTLLNFKKSYKITKFYGMSKILSEE